jgi:hypothetical protein
MRASHVYRLNPAAEGNCKGPFRFSTSLLSYPTTCWLEINCCDPPTLCELFELFRPCQVFTFPVISVQGQYCKLVDECDFLETETLGRKSIPVHTSLMQTSFLSPLLICNRILFIVWTLSPDKPRRIRHSGDLLPRVLACFST